MISVVIPAYNCKDTLKTTVRSILKQTYSDYEILIINDGSTDETEKIALELCKEDSRIKVISKANNGVSSARNCGIDEAVGENICFVDSDDTVEPKYLESLIINAGDGAVPCVGYVINENEQPRQKADIGKEYIIKNKLDEDFFTGKLRHSVAFAVWNKLYSTEVLRINNIRFCEELRMGEDMLFVLQYLFRSKKIAYSNEPVYHYNIRQSSAVRSAQEDILSQYELLLTHLKELKSEGFKISYDSLSCWSLESLSYVVSNRYLRELPVSRFFKYCRNELFKSEIYLLAVSCKKKCSFKRRVFRFALRTKNSLLLYFILKGIKD